VSEAGRRVASQVVGAAALIAVVTVAARLVGFVRLQVMAQTVGTSCLGTAYTTANAIPNLVFEIVVGGALAGSVVPLLAGALSRGDRAQARATTAALYGWVLVLLVPAFVLVVLLRGPLASLLIGDAGSGCVSADVHATGAALLGLFALQIPIYGLTVVSQGALQSDHRFTAPAVAPLLSSLVMIAVYLAYSADAGGSAGSLADLSTAQLWLLGAGTTVGVLVLFLTQLPAAARAGLLVAPRLHFPHGLGSRARALAGAGLATVAAQWISYAVSLRLVNQHGPQGASVVFVLAWTVLLLPWAVLVFPVATSVFPRLATSHERGDRPGFAATTASSLRAVLLLAAMGAAGLFAVAEPLSRFLVEGAPGRPSTGELAASISALALGVVGFALVGFGGRVLYAAHRGRLAASATIAGWVIAMGLAVVVSWTVSANRVVPAVAAATSVGLLVGGVVVTVGVQRVAGAAALHRLGRAAGAAAVALLLAGALGRGVAAALPWRGVWGSAAVAVAASLVVVAVWLGVVWCLDRSDLRALARRGVGPVGSH
jgi:putative peptidoglycan lipid II flippase